MSREIGGTLQFIGERISELMIKSQMQDALPNTLQLSNFEDMRSVSIQTLDRMGDDEENKDIVIEALVYLKERMKQWQESQVQSMQTVPDSNGVNLPSAGQFID